MSASTAKANRRDLRRALGTVAADQLPEHAERLNALTVSTNLAHDRIDHVDARTSDAHVLIGAADSFLTILESHLESQRADFTAFTKRPWKARLRWLFTGR